MRFICATLAAAAVWIHPSPASACTVVGTIPSSQELVAQADVIVVAVAREFVPNTEPSRPIDFISDIDDCVAAGILPGRVRFEVLETIKGQFGGQTLLVFPGGLTERDDFNDTPVPQNGPRAEAREGSWAFSYRREAAYLLLLKSTNRGTLTPYWSALGRVNDQVHPEGDQWVEWVRRQAN